MPADLPTREQVEAVRGSGPANATHGGARLAEDIRAICALALRVLDAPERTLTPAERATWGTCPVCARPSGIGCVETDPPMPARIRGDVSYFHAARLDAAPLRVQLVAVP